jgi:hypothetical protein
MEECAPNTCLRIKYVTLIVSAEVEKIIFKVVLFIMIQSLITINTQIGLHYWFFPENYSKEVGLKF